MTTSVNTCTKEMSTSPASSKEVNSQEPEPQLSFEVLTTQKDKYDALKLVADSVAQQRQLASRAIIFNPIGLTTLATAILAIYLSGWAPEYGVGASLTTYSGLILTYLVAIRYLTSPYIHLAEDTDWRKWLQNADGNDDTVLGARYGSDIIATCILRIDNHDVASAKKIARKGTQNKADSTTAFIRALTTRVKYRRCGLGGDLLYEAVRVAKETGGKNTSIEIAEDHANSKLVLPQVFNGPFRRRGMKVKKMLVEAVTKWEAS